MERTGENKENEKRAANPATRFTASADQADRRLDRVLRGLFEDVPLGAIMRAIRKGQVRVNGLRAEGSDRLSEGDAVDAPWLMQKNPARFLGDCAASFPPLVTLYRDEDIWCVEKEPGLLSQPDKQGADSLITRAWAELAWDRWDFRPALIHRLDRNVSGVVAIALNAPVLRTLTRLLREGQLEKIYRALVWGSTPPLGEISVSLRKDEQKNQAYVDEEGKNALTRFRRIGGNARVSLVELELVTGRPHQARVHLASIGHPIVGDTKYGKRNDEMKEVRLMLHAYSLKFPDNADLPERICGLNVISPLPASFCHLDRLEVADA